MYDIISDMLNKNFKIKVSLINKLQGGWSAYAYKVDSYKQEYFLKVFDKHRHTSQDWINRIDGYMPIVMWLFNNSQLRGKMTAPILTTDGSYKCEDKDYVFMLFPYIDGFTLNETELTQRQQQDIAVIISELHLYGRDIPISTQNIVENFDVTFCDQLVAMLTDEGIGGHEDLTNAWLPYKSLISASVETVKRLADELRSSDLNYVLCHTDVHGWNLMQTDRLILIDWEGLRLAPAEADLFAFTDGFFFGYAWDKFISVYKHAHPGFEINQDALIFYRLRRRLEDIHAFAEGILYNGLSSEDTIVSLKHLIRECSLLK